MRSNVLLLALVAFAAAQETPLTECQKCCSPGGDCSKANKGNPGVCCGQSNGGLGYCCPIAVAGRPAKCWNCGSEYRCYTGSRPPPTICGGGGNPSYGRSDGTQTSLISALVAVLCVVLIASAISQCMRARRVPLAAQQDIAMQPVQHYGVPMAKPGQPIVGGQCAGMPVATGVPAGGCYPQAYPAAHGYPAQSGYSGGTVAMGAGMGFLGGMMMGEMMSDVVSALATKITGL
eukprot:CAMPEP_0174756326 /NCGR_PEP_ID=MMETSP1094-20130205/106701_1 /TAXON_ID=156173 /ORGANISM="Chrysochromulina brevifilum, Strain UTEX LB 985" /LENGTH=232 /DNA_ID=CAMNT_0015962233 /DNA_START=84 /DNA_END=782 /DNA_ORIENTATION=+